MNELLKEFYKSAQALHEAWSVQDDEALVNKYPFEKSFNEVVNDIREWSENND